jgi:hypothetical protein
MHTLCRQVQILSQTCALRKQQFNKLPLNRLCLKTKLTNYEGTLVHTSFREIDTLGDDYYVDVTKIS